MKKLLLENAHMKKNCTRKSARGGRTLLTGLMRCGRCGRMMRVFYSKGKGNDIGIGGVRVDRAVAMQVLEAAPWKLRSSLQIRSSVQAI